MKNLSTLTSNLPSPPKGGWGVWRHGALWLALELILVTFACWWAFDPVIVTSYVARLPLGYDIDRMVKLQVASSSNYKERDADQYAIMQEEERLLGKVREMDGVEQAYRAKFVPMGLGLVGGIYFLYNDNGDSIQVYGFRFEPDSKMFEVYGMKSLTPGVPTNELTHDCEWDKSIIIPRSLAMGLFGTTDVAGRNVLVCYYGWDEEKMETGWLKKHYNIRAVVEDVRYQSFDHNYATVFLCSGGENLNVPIIVRLREGVNADCFVQEHQQEVQREMVTEHCYVRQMLTVREALEKGYGEVTMKRMTRRNLLFAAFFATNMAFGVLGTLLMYMRQRREEAGVRRAFGATRWSIFWGFIREAWLLTTISVIIGCTIYFQFATAKGLFTFGSHSNPAVHFWFDDFGTHFLVVSACVYIIILCTVLLGTAIPAWRISRSEITESLREE
ncbi:MAG: FtsX-like permease family protein [Bacteroidaceae bacterium]|nr:FtsX-like permease family protein [Bacteroidaceae bacterium]